MTSAKPKRLYQQIAAILRSRIEAGDYPVGSRMPAERLIAEELDISRTVVREALILLEIENRVEVRKGSGIYVIEPKEAAVEPSPEPYHDELSAGPFEMIQARQLVESNIAEFAARQITKAGILELQEISARSRAEDRYRDSDWDRRFHLGVASATQNSVLVYLVEKMWYQRERNPMWRKLFDRIDNRESLASWCDDHDAILRALIRRDPVEARSAMWRHLENTRQMLFDASTVEDGNEVDRYIFSDNPLQDLDR
ncbi:FCD domain-containing protein [Halotalea alkalilenta]|uniref:Transcriptional regulator n=1 Tax=Halotalea alkalilenta TaxID=376489 RepID=A0A172YAL4_9GAMM|nr:FCD domain-containing protein [Halotalea alkalilenta]ANF56269.1 transcriptional regulator [Halotalea alkalilenta]